MKKPASKSPEQLFTCPKCHTPNFTARGIKSHNCDRRIVAAGTSQDELKGEQLTEQYHRATDGTKQVLIFGAMMLMVEKEVTVSARGHGGKFGAKGDGLKAWLTKFAPTINRSTAYRFRDVAESIAKSFELPPKTDFIKIATTPMDELKGQQRKLQLALFDFVSGTSQRSWLDKFKRPVKHRNPGKDDDQETDEINLAEVAITEFNQASETVHNLKEEMTPKQWDAALASAREHLEKLTDCKWESKGGDES